MAKTGKGIKTPLALLVLLLVTAGCVFGGFTFVNNAKKQFAAAEAKLPESGISDYLLKIRNQRYDEIYEDSLVVAPHLNAKEDYIATLKDIYANADTSRIEFAPAEEGENTYNLVYNHKYLATLKLLQAADGTWKASTVFAGNNDYVVEAPAGLKISVNGIELTDEYLLEKNVTASNFLGLHDKTNAPKVDRYELTNLLAKPVIKVVGETGYTTLDDVLSNTIFVGRDAQSADLARVFIDDIKVCAQFPAQESGLGAVAAVSITNSDWYDRIRTMQNNWFTSHGTSRFSNETARNIIQQSDDTMVGYVTFDYYASNGEVSRTWNSGFQVTFMKQGGIWKIAGMAVDSTLNPAVEWEND